MEAKKLKFLYDDKNRLICMPYSVDNLFIMANELKIKKCWFESDNHYIIPDYMIDKIHKVGKRTNIKVIDAIINRVNRRK